MKKISILIPCYNEEGKVSEIFAAVVGVLRESLPEYD